MNKTIGIVIGGVLVAGAAFAGGYFLAANKAVSTGTDGRAAFARLSESERQQLSSMSEEERQAFFKEKGIEMPAGGPMGQGGAPGQQGTGAPNGQRGPGASLLEGTVSDMTADKLTIALTAGGSASAYYDDKTVVASVEGKSPTLEKGATVIVFTEPEAAGVNAAQAIVVR